MTPAHYLRPLLAPQSVVLVGASGRAGSLGRVVYENLLEGEFEGELFAVNPSHATVLGRRCYRSIRAVGKQVDLAVICAPANSVPGILDDCSGRVRAALILTGAPGASPAEYRRWRSDLDARARAGKIRVLGPASFGIVRTSSGLNASLGSVPALRGRLTLISQSGAVASALLDFAHGVGIGFASVAVLGAAADVDFGEILEFALADPETDGIVLYVETLRDARVFLSALRAAARTKPVIVLRSGRAAASMPSERGPPEEDRVFDAALRRAGTVRVHTYTQLFAAAAILAAGRIPRGHRLAIVSNGRGPALMAADRATETGVALAAPAVETRGALAALLPRKREVDNPVDLEGEATPAQLAEAVRILLADREVDAVLALHVAAPAAPPTDSARAVAEVAKDAAKPVLAAWLGSVDRREPRAALEAGGVVNFYTPENAVEAFSFLAAYRRNQQWLLEVPAPSPELGAPDIAAALRVRSRAAADGRSVLCADETHALLGAFGIRVAAFAVARSAAGAQSAARRIGYPVTLELDGEEEGTSAHRELRSSATVARAFREIRSARGRARQAVVVRKDFGAVPGHAVRIGVYTDSVFGPVVAFGAARAGIAELSLMLPPLNRRLAIDLIESARGIESAGGLDALVALLLRNSSLVCASPWVVQLELGQVAITPRGAIVGSARTVIDAGRPPSAARYEHMAIHPYPSELETTLTLRGGARLHVRPIRPEDADLERAFVVGLSEESRYRRFMQNLPGLTPQMLARFTQVDYDRELALIALRGGAGREKMLAVARYVANPDRESAEFAIAVADAWQGRGLGRALMNLLIARARERRYTHLVGNVLASNAPMLALVSSLGFVVAHDPNDAEQVIVTLELAPRMG